MSKQTIDVAKTMKLLPKRGNLANPRCPTREVIDSITGLWGVMILRALSDHSVLRNAGIKRLIPGISEKMLSQTLKRLERIGFVSRTSYPEVPPRVEYRLTKLGFESTKHLRAFCDSVEYNMRTIARQMLDFDGSDQSRAWQRPRR